MTRPPRPPAPRAQDLVVSGFGSARMFGRVIPCALGRGGRTTDKREGDGATPIGRYRLEWVYSRPDRLAPPRSCAAHRPIRIPAGWSDDPQDPAYNRPVTRPHPFRHERLRRADPLYDLIGVIDANRDPIEPGRGSALFLHVWRGPRYPTAGCIAFRRADLHWILTRWRCGSRVIIR